MSLKKFEKVDEMTQSPGNVQFKKIARIVVATLITTALTACGGGGGSAGTTGAAGTGTTGTPVATGGTGGTVTTPVVTTPTIRLALLNGTTATTSISASGATTAQATVLDEKSQPVLGKLVTFSGDAKLITFNPPSGAVLTDAVTGIAKIQVAPASLTSTGAGSLSVSANVVPSTGGTGVVTTASLDYQLSAANLTLTGLDVTTSAPLAAYGTRPVTVVANVNGSPSTSTPVQITFSASCGTVSPATVTTDGTGKAASTYTANSTAIPGCAGANVTITAAATGASSQTGLVTVQATNATNIQFTGATPQLIYLAGSVGATQSQVGFKVVDSNGGALSNQTVTLSLTNTSTGVSLGTVGNSAPLTVTTDASGVASTAVFSGSIPTSIQVNAVLASNAAVSTKSNILIVASGVPVQKAASLSREKFSIEGFSVDGTTTKVTFSLADRQGNPVPVGTAVNFVSSSGVMIPATCIVPALADGTSSSSCVSSIRSQGTRPLNGQVAILAYTPGEEDFVDLNGNNIYDAGDTFTDIGNAYRDDNFDGAFTAGEFSVPRNGSTTCAGGIYGKANTCDGIWGAIDVRGQTMVVFATGSAVFSNVNKVIAAGISFAIADQNGNSLPTGTKIAVSARPGLPAGSCTVSTTGNIVINTIGATTVPVLAGATCVAGDFVDVAITSPLGVASSRTFTLM